MLDVDRERLPIRSELLPRPDYSPKPASTALPDEYAYLRPRSPVLLRVGPRRRRLLVESLLELELELE
jgi:hypothetical protein